MAGIRLIVFYNNIQVFLHRLIRLSQGKKLNYVLFINCPIVIPIVYLKSYLECCLHLHIENSVDWVMWVLQTNKLAKRNLDWKTMWILFRVGDAWLRVSLFLLEAVAFHYLCKDKSLRNKVSPALNSFPCDLDQPFNCSFQFLVLKWYFYLLDNWHSSGHTVWICHSEPFP